MPSTIIALASYVFVTTFTPGPNNISSTAAGLNLGYRKALPYRLGIALGFSVIMLATGICDKLLQANIQGFLAIAKWVGFAYMLWLIVGLFLPHGKAGEKKSEFTFVSGLLLQVVNVKVLLYGLTIYAMFPAILASSAAALLVSAIVFAMASFASVSLWCFAGSTLSRLLSDKRILLGFNIVLALMLGYCAYSIVAG